ncbi:aromatic aminobenezylarsenical efflux permease ArsG family transporter [Chrysiogenes arsenatis]|uniref:aromatic aminobenezylarsenical efflux permease ArsG family transporter n=1 Tax=Chrysiogenes arsenatis TaxID=309797 RepID=UPI0003FAA9A3|nr:aromatic aminobenezylarsenical efflux permease ArsG family transporter [Chrysiogenes arsenatis]
MDISLLALISAAWLGIITAMSPCPLATNIAAVSFIGGQSGKKFSVLASGLLYAAGRTVAYVALGALIVFGLFQSSDISLFLQKYLNDALGPLLILAGLLLLGWIGKGLSFGLHLGKFQDTIAGGSVAWAFPLGALFALSFCPISAGLFFGGLLPLALQQQSAFLMPAAYGIGTALPVIVFAFVLAFASASVGRIFEKVSLVERYVRPLAGAVFIVVGLYYSIFHLYGW